MRRIATVCGLALASFSSCLAGGPDRSDEEVAESESPIINGTPDTTTKAAVWLLDQQQGGSCTGTIIKVDGDTGYVLTAAHCSSMDYVVVANNYQSCLNQTAGCEAVFEVTQQIYHPNWNDDPGNGYDFSLIRFTGANGFPHVIPPAKAPDGLSNNAQLDIVGYGQTESGNNSLRKHKITSLEDYNDGFLVHYSTVCFGDSGGPAIFNGKVVGVSSFVTDDACMDYGVSGRVTLVYDWIESFTGPIGQTTSSASSSASSGPGATTGAGTGGFGEGGFAGEGAAPPTQLGPDDDYEWFPGKQDDKDEDGDSSSCSANAAGMADASRGGGSLGLLFGLALWARRRRMRSGS